MAGDAVRYFRCFAGDEAYEQIRATLDAAWGHPNAVTKTTTCIDPASVAPRDRQGRIMLATSEAFCEYEAAAQMLPLLISGGTIEEIDAATYLQELPQIPVQ
jgi:alkylhydroperoxidase family enzyme